ncbi:nuclear transport factor 2 family protein [Radicibacter daui]|uniref:nuclear transport factor 2 family protein n=1 Tax=Radicibacter daui TaxID=3064829 RepID=UPI00404690C8
MRSAGPDIAEIRALEEALHKPEVRCSREVLEALLAEGFVEFGASGAVYDRAQIIELLLHEGSEAEEPLSIENYALTTISNDAVLLTYRSHRKRPDGSQRHVLRSSIWTRAAGRWQMLFHQGTVTGPVA